MIAPASRCPPERLEAGIRVLESWGLQVRVPDPLYGRVPMVANTEQARWRHLRRALVAPDSDAVWCVRGGYGCLHLAPRLVAMQPPSRAKPLIGFSDVTALHAVLDERWGWPVVHGPVVAQLGDGSVAQSDLTRLRQLLSGERDGFEYARLKLVPGAYSSQASSAEQVSSNARGGDVSPVIKGRLFGGNLTTLQTLVGSRAEASARGRILVLEDVNERGYTVDRMFRVLENAGALRGVRAVVLGQFLRGNEPDGKSLVPAAFRNLAARLRCPVLTGLPFGHGKRLTPLVLGAQAELTADQGRWQLSYEVAR